MTRLPGGALLAGSLLLSLSLPLLAAGPAAGTAQDTSGADPVAPTALLEVVEIVDGDTLHVLRGGKKEKLRLLSVDTEEKLDPQWSGSASKPQTVFGEETRLWTIAYFEQWRDRDGKIRVGLRFPGGREERGAYGRLLCHVILPDGTDFNLLLVRLGKSPYFNKYGNSLISHGAFVEAQRQARRNLLGIWDPSTNQSRSEGAPSAKRPYEELLPWWQARAEAIDGFRRRSSADPTEVIHAEDADALETTLSRDEPAGVEVFGTPERFFDEEDGSWTVLFRSTDRARAFRARIPAAKRAAFEPLELPRLLEEYRQNYVYVRGRIIPGRRGPEMVTPDPTAWRRAGPEP